MIQLKQIYKCSVCGNIIEVVHASVGQLVCCGKPMELMEENKTDASQEKHVPVIEKTVNGFRVKVGSVAHPMEKEHYIEWIEAMVAGLVYRKFLKPGASPEAEFCLEGEKIIAREYCNLHGLWQS